jgi:hypothetical protein
MVRNGERSGTPRNDRVGTVNDQERIVENGHCTVTVRSLYGHCTVTLRSLYGHGTVTVTRQNQKKHCIFSTLKIKMKVIIFKFNF